MQLISKFNNGIRFLLCAIYIFSKYAWVVEEKKAVIIVNASQKILNDSKTKPNKIWLDEGCTLYNNSFKNG